MGHQPVRNAFCAHLVSRFAESQCFGLREEVRHEQVVMCVERIESLIETYEIAGYQLRALVQQLVKGVLPVRAWLSPQNRTGLIIDTAAIQIGLLTIALHV